MSRKSNSSTKAYSFPGALFGFEFVYSVDKCTLQSRRDNSICHVRLIVDVYTASTIDKGMASTIAQRENHARPHWWKPNFWTKARCIRLWHSLHLDTATVLQMLKGGLPPLIVVSMYVHQLLKNPIRF